MPSMNMIYQLIEIQFDTLSAGIRFNGTSRIVLKDKDVYNGVVHGINSVLKFMTTQLPYFMKENSDISIFTEALFLTHLSDSILPIRDMISHPPKVYYMYNLNSGSVVHSPNRKYGFTAFVEDNNLLKLNGIQNIQNLIERANQLYPSESKYATDYTNRNNSLNKYISYHLVNKAIYTNTFFYRRNAVKGYTPDEFLETMLSNRIIRVSNQSSQITLNFGSNYTSHVKEADNQRAVNGVYHLLDRMLVYSETVERMLQNTRIRFDVSSLFPELTNNNIRGTEGQNPNSNAPGYYFGFDSGYLKNITFTEQTQLYYASGIEVASDIFPNFQTDIFEVSGDYDLTVKLLPVPPGTYELRFGYHVNSGGNLAQIYVDNKLYGIPFPIWTKLDNKLIGSILDELTDDNDVKIDGILHYKGYMKAPENFMVNSDGLDARHAPYVIRKIVGVFTLTDYQSHSIRFKSIVSIKGSPFELDYFEFVPKSIFSPPGDEKEGRD